MALLYLLLKLLSTGKLREGDFLNDENFWFVTLELLRRARLCQWKSLCIS